MNIKNRFSTLVAICALISFAQNAAAQNDHTETSGVDGAVSDENKTSYKPKDDDYVENLIKTIPYGQSLKHSWNVADGDVDLYFEDLRVNRSNKGVSYTTDSLPIFGQLDGSQFRADLGEDSQLSFRSDYVPFVGRIDGFQFRAAAGTDDSTISLSYKIDLDW
jgi:hypothetical protein